VLTEYRSLLLTVTGRSLAAPDLSPARFHSTAVDVATTHSYFAESCRPHGRVTDEVDICVTVGQSVTVMTSLGLLRLRLYLLQSLSLANTGLHSKSHYSENVTAVVGSRPSNKQSNKRSISSPCDVR